MSEELSQYKLLVVDDEVDLLEVVTCQFGFAGFSTVSAGSANEAIEKLKSEDIHLVLCDVRMPETDGMGLLKQVKADFPTVPVIMMSGYSDYSENEFIQEGAVGLVEKPIDMESLKALIISRVAGGNQQAAGEGL